MSFLQALLKSFLTNLMSPSAVCRRMAASSLSLICQYSRSPLSFFTYLITVILGMVSVCHSGHGVCSVYTCTDRAPSVPSPVSSPSFWVWCLFVILGMVSVLCMPVLTDPPQFLHLSHHSHSGYSVCLSFWVWCLFCVYLY